jgi:hypothetical protein
VLLYTGLRIGDAARLGRQHIQKDGAIKLRTEKTGADVVIGIVPPLARAFVAGPHGRHEVLNFITGARGRPMDKSPLGHWFGAACQAIGSHNSQYLIIVIDLSDCKSDSVPHPVPHRARAKPCPPASTKRLRGP